MRVELDVYSGRPNPVWDLDDGQSAELAVRLRSLAAAAAAALPDGLGYRGLRLTPRPGGVAGPTAAERIEIGAGRVHVTRADGTTRQLADTGRTLERWLIDTARGRIDEALRRAVSDEAAGTP